MEIKVILIGLLHRIRISARLMNIRKRKGNGK
jgi:hypothetical protein